MPATRGVAVGMGLCAVVKGLEDDGFAAGVASARDEGDLAGLQDCAQKSQ